MTKMNILYITYDLLYDMNIEQPNPNNEVYKKLQIPY